MIEIKNVNFEKVYDPYLVETDFGDTSYVDFIVHNASSSATGKVVLYFEKSETLGSLEHPATFEPYIDYYDLIKLGNEKIANNNSIGYLSIEFEGSEYIFNRNLGSKKSNGINLGSFLSDERKAIRVKIEAPPYTSSRRLFVNMVAE